MLKLSELEPTQKLRNSSAGTKSAGGLIEAIKDGSYWRKDTWYTADTLEQVKVDVKRETTQRG